MQVFFLLFRYTKKTQNGDGKKCDEKKCIIIFVAFFSFHAKGEKHQQRYKNI